MAVAREQHKWHRSRRRGEPAVAFRPADEHASEQHPQPYRLAGAAPSRFHAGKVQQTEMVLWLAWVMKAAVN